jgi:hypothetical protein
MRGRPSALAELRSNGDSAVAESEDDPSEPPGTALEDAVLQAVSPASAMAASDASAILAALRVPAVRV